MATDGELFRRSVRDPEVFEEIFERHGPSVWSYVRRRIGAEAVEDVVSETFLVAFERRSRFDPSYESARPWLFGIATNLVRRRLRDERAYLERMRRIPVDVVAIDATDPDRADAQRLRPALTDAVLALAPDDRETFCLVALNEFTYAEAAEALGIPVGTVRSRIHRARTQLRERIPGLPAIDDEGSVAERDG